MFVYHYVAQIVPAYFQDGIYKVDGIYTSEKEPIVSMEAYRRLKSLLSDNEVDAGRLRPKQVSILSLSFLHEIKTPSAQPDYSGHPQA